MNVRGFVRPTAWYLRHDLRRGRGWHYNRPHDGLQLGFLGDLQVVRDGERLALPPSRKTRALLAYLALSRRAFRREHLCELLWEVPDDPRGSLRWSLSKLRRLVDDGERSRLVADRLAIELDTTDVSIDVVSLQGLSDEALERGPVEALEEAAVRYGGEPLAGLDLPNFHDYSLWLTAQRDLATRSQLRLLRAVQRRLPDDPERALPHAYACVRIEPYDETARATVIALLVALGRHDQANRQHELGLRLLKEAGLSPTGALARAARMAPSPSAANETRSPRGLPVPGVKPGRPAITGHPSPCRHAGAHCLAATPKCNASPPPSNARSLRAAAGCCS